MPGIVRLFLGLIIIAAGGTVVLACGLGLLGTLEPMAASTRWTWRLVFAMIAGSVTIGTVWGLILLWRRRPPTRTPDL